MIALLIHLMTSAVLFFLGWTVPRTWVPGELVTASMMNTHVRDNMNFLRATAQLSQITRGMRLRTHPDSDKAATTVMLVGCDELVTDLGTRVNPRGGLTADITVSGAGGIDTGARVAATWYEIYYVFKGPTAGSPDNPQGPSADALVFHRAKDWKLAEQNTSTATSEKLRQGAADRLKLAQGFKASTFGGPIDFVDAMLTKTGAPSGRVWFTIESDNAGSPSGTVLATSEKLDVAAFQTAATSLYRIPFRSPFSPVDAATQYHLVLQGDYAVSVANYVSWFGDTVNNYANGSAKKFDGTVWAAATPLDFYFKVYVTENNTAVTLPAGYTEKCLLAHVYNSGGNVLATFTALDRAVRVNPTISQLLAAGTATVPTFVDLAALIPPVAVRIMLFASGSVAGDQWVIEPVSMGYGGTATNAPYVAFYSPGAGYQTNQGFLFTEFQGLYYNRGVGTGNLNAFIQEWVW